LWPGVGEIFWDVHEEVGYHLETIQLALNETNRQYQEAVAGQKREQERQEAENAIHDATVRETLVVRRSRFTN